ncbi:MAG: hypothetical protein HEP71_20965 [Roseivirga sp.]|nr:hypothetical protein [Roseivirga sp.]
MSNSSINELGIGFKAMSAAFTGFNESTLQGTGLNDVYLQTVCNALNQTLVEELIALYATLVLENPDNPKGLKHAMRHQIFASPKWAPLAQNIIQLWYTGTWNQMSFDWTQAYGPFFPNDNTAIVSSDSYKQGLIWKAVGAHPMGAKQEGFASWAFPPPSAPEN